MATLNQIRVAWNGAPGMPGVSTFYSTGDPSFLVSKLKTFYDAMKSNIPNTVVISYPSSGVTIDTATGEANGSWAITAPASTVCTGAGTYAGPVGAVINWKTGLYVGGRELRGKTFLVPLVSGVFGTDGKMSAGQASTIQGFASAVLGGGNPLVVYGRASASNAPVTSATVPTKAAVLRSRRD